MDREYGFGVLLSLLFLAALVLLSVLSGDAPGQRLPVTCSDYPEQSAIELPPPNHSGKTLEDAVAQRRSVRVYSNGTLSLAELSMLLWAGDGVTDNSSGLRSAPSAGGLYPIYMYVMPNRVENASCGIYMYHPENHSLTLVKEGGFSGDAYDIALSQAHVRDAALLIMLVSVPERTTGKYGDEAGRRFALLEAGHIAQNILLEAVSLGLGAVPVGGFEQSRMDSLLMLSSKEESVYIIAVGEKVG